MKEKIFNYIKENPGCRKREAAGHLMVWQCRSDFLDAFHELEKEGRIFYRVHNDPANMEYYDMWYVRA